MGTVGSLRDVPGAFKRCSPGASRHRVNGNFERSVEPSFSRKRLNCAHIFREEWPWELKEKKARKKRHFAQVSEPRASARAPSSVTRSYVVASTTAAVSFTNLTSTGHLLYAAFDPVYSESTNANKLFRTNYSGAASGNWENLETWNPTKNKK